jgi:hypothetical protein
MAYVHNDLWRQVFWGATVSDGARARCNLLCESEIRNFKMSIVCNKQILGLQVSVGNAPPVEIIKRLHYLSDIEESDIIREEAFTAEQTKDFAPLYIFES